MNSSPRFDPSLIMANTIDWLGKMSSTLYTYLTEAQGVCSTVQSSFCSGNRLHATNSSRVLMTLCTRRLLSDSIRTHHS